MSLVYEYVSNARSEPKYGKQHPLYLCSAIETAWNHAWMIEKRSGYPPSRVGMIESRARVKIA